MKYVLFIFCCATFCGCFLHEQKKGNGNVTKENRPVSTFNSIKVSGVFNMILQQGSAETVQVETDENLQNLIVVKVENGELNLYMKENSSFKNSTKMNVVVVCKNINALQNKLVGSLKTEGVLQLPLLEYTSSAVGNTELNVELDKAILDIKAVGNTIIKGKATTCTFTNTAVGGFDGAAFLVENMSLKNSAVGNTTVNVTNLELQNTGVGRMENLHHNN